MSGYWTKDRNQNLCMNNKKDILICGHRSFVATGLINLLSRESLHFDTFSRGMEGRDGVNVSGDVLNIHENQYLNEYDCVINFIILKNLSVEENLKYIRSLLTFCEKNHVKRLIQISSISAYPNEAAVITEKSEIEKDWHNKGGYASIKVAVDHFIEENKPKDLEVVYVRPGFIYSKQHEISKAGILFSKFGLNILLGDKETTLPLISRSKIHEALVKIVLAEKAERVYLLLNPDKEDGTKYNFVTRQWKIKPIPLPSAPLLLIAKILRAFGVFKEKHYLKTVGLFKRTWFDSRVTEEKLGLNLGKRRFAVLGAGTYGSYITNLLSIVYPHEAIDLYDVGDEHLKTENEAGFLSHIIGAPYEGLQKARFFGFGGASVKWGGQLLTFGDNDFVSPTPYMKDVVELNKKWKDAVLSKFGLVNHFPEERLNDLLFTKTGVWLSYFHRNLFKHFNIIHNKQVHIIRHARVSKILCNRRNITGFEYIQDEKKSIASGYEQYFLSSGAFESCRLLVHSGLSAKDGQMSFSDHLSQRAFHVTSGPKMGNQDFTFHVQGASLVTKRFTGEVDGYSFYSQPINNEDFPFFKDLKSMLFGHQIKLSIIWNIIKNIPSCIAFAWDMLILKKLYVYKNQFYLQIDIEAPRESGLITLNEQKDGFGEKSVNVNLKIMPKTGELFSKARAVVKQWLDENNVSYTELPFSTTAEKYEDVYHPFGMFCEFESVDDYFKHFDNMLVVNTGVLQRAGGINSTCAVLPLVEEYINNVMD